MGYRMNQSKKSLRGDPVARGLESVRRRQPVGPAIPSHLVQRQMHIAAVGEVDLVSSLVGGLAGIGDQLTCLLFKSIHISVLPNSVAYSNGLIPSPLITFRSAPLAINASTAFISSRAIARQMLLVAARAIANCFAALACSSAAMRSFFLRVFFSSCCCTRILYSLTDRAPQLFDPHGKYREFV